MASIVARRSSYAVVYMTTMEGQRKQKWKTYHTREEVERRKNCLNYTWKAGKAQLFIRWQRFKEELLSHFFPKNYTPMQKQQVILKLLEDWHKRQMRQHEPERYDILGIAGPEKLPKWARDAANQFKRHKKREGEE